LDEFRAAHLVALDEFRVVQSLQHRVNVEVVGWENVDLDLLGAVLQATFTIRNSPQASEKQARSKVEFNQVFVREEPGFDVPRTRHA
jgi:hypothetical protein